MGGEQDMRKMGRLRHKMPITFITFPGRNAGARRSAAFAASCQDEIIWQAFAHGHLVVWALLLLGAAMTVFCMFRRST